MDIVAKATEKGPTISHMRFSGHGEQWLSCRSILDVAAKNLLAKYRTDDLDSDNPRMVGRRRRSSAESTEAPEPGALVVRLVLDAEPDGGDPTADRVPPKTQSLFIAG